MTFRLAPGKSDAIRFTGKGPFDQRMGYSQLPHFADRLKANHYLITDQARISSRMAEVVDEGLFAPYREKISAGLSLQDCAGESIFDARYPERVYDKFENVPPLLIQSLLFIENRELLDFEKPTKKPGDRMGPLQQGGNGSGHPPFHARSRCPGR